MTQTVPSVPAGRHQIDGRTLGERHVKQSLWRGAMLHCPACGRGELFRRYLKVADYCPDCGEALHHHRADDAPPYFTMVILGHILVSLVLIVEIAYHPPLWVHVAIWFPLAIVLALVLLPRVKGALVALQWALLMHGFDPENDEERSAADPQVDETSSCSPLLHS
jgi:uncharacterized protein (DUF983 family)